MKTQDILNLDYTKDKNKQIIQKALLMVEPLNKYSDEDMVPFESIEKMLYKICQKYMVYIKIDFDCQCTDHGCVLRCNIIRVKSLEVMPYVYGMCMYELFAKVVILLWKEIKNKKLERR